MMEAAQLTYCLYTMHCCNIGGIPCPETFATLMPCELTSERMNGTRREQNMAADIAPD